MKEKISVIGAGTMGTGIAQVAATHSYRVSLIDSNNDALEHSRSKLMVVMYRLIEKNQISHDESSEILSRIEWSSEIHDISDSKIIIEAVVEDISVKQKIL